MIRNLREKIKNEEGISTLEFVILIPIYFLLIWIAFEALFFYSFIVFDGFADARDEVLSRCYKANSTSISTFNVEGGIPILADLIDIMTIFFPDSEQLTFRISAAGR
ncbi:hypothetical protein ACFL27_11475 [candidate division CSSED10-310 bacterium]|uniref:Pilus assembly protein n=1 Tax=candidate division CSSED10-310 bacterium TaxID=2855610 RepID=A0ABV6YX76_UNCC1